MPLRDGKGNIWVVGVVLTMLTGILSRRGFHFLALCGLSGSLWAVRSLSTLWSFPREGIKKRNPKPSWRPRVFSAELDFAGFSIMRSDSDHPHGRNMQRVFDQCAHTLTLTEGSARPCKVTLFSMRLWILGHVCLRDPYSPPSPMPDLSPSGCVIKKLLLRCFFV
jgi:hypothetical protein